MLIRFAELSEHPEILKLYEACSYGGGVQSGDLIVVAVDNGINRRGKGLFRKRH